MISSIQKLWMSRNKWIHECTQATIMVAMNHQPMFVELTLFGLWAAAGDVKSLFTGWMWCFPSSAASCGLMLASVLLCSSGSVLSALRRSSAGEFLAEDSNPCFSLRENEDQRQLLCNDRRSKFNFNPFGLRFGKRYNGYIYRRAVKTARTNKFPLLSLFSRELDEHWCFCE